MRTRRNVITLMAASVIAGVSPALRQAQAAAANKLPVVATFSVLADLARNVGGDRVEVISLVGPNGDAHVYQPSPEDAKHLNAAKLILVNGLGLEGWLDRLISASGAKAPIVVATKGIEPRQMEEEGKIGEDPHAWQSIPNAKIYVENIRDGLIAVDPGGADAYRANATAYLARLDELDKEVRAALAAIPPKRREIITTHDAFGYFGAAYDFKFIAPEGVSTETEASARDVARIIRQIKTEKIPAVFLENITDPRIARRIAEESGATIGGALFSDALSPPDGPAPTYVEMMRNNIKQLTAALSK
ncbi:ABC transporter substrate-binding protein [Methylocella tundrae]|uniref:ABC transporter substrate-binding protein n=1 Tax=Methylocella tundrae TaxID=227605 RepID=A0A4U8Z435_METTU|nr:metal ABC transporter substrate-binding protein [Methylocella tundrae]VFU10220.1 ABC transporter substrate-binding protein [Methylocella tundrae]